MVVDLYISSGLRALVPTLPNEMRITMEGPAPVNEILVRAGINPLLVMVVAVDGIRTDKTHLINNTARVEVIGPLDGG